MKKLYTYLFFTFHFSLFTSICSAQFTDILNFNNTNGSEPFGTLTPDANGKKLYGTNYIGGSIDSGCVFSINANGTNYKIIYNFTGSSGSRPNSPVTLVNGILFGTANFGGAHDSGCIYSVDTNGTHYRDLFDFTGPNGKNPYNSILYASGKLFGVADGGLKHVGCIFAIDTNGVGYSDIFDFDSAHGEYPLGITLVGHKLYGAALEGGAHNYGLVYSVNTNGTSYSDLLDFDVTNGFYPSGPVTYLNAKLYGATTYGGLYDYGSLFSLDTNGTKYKDLFDFDYTNGYMPEYAGGGLIVSGNELYGSTYEGGTNDSGAIFSIDTNGSNYKVLYNFTWTTGSHPEGSLTQLGSTFYGATAYGGPSHNGVLFAFDTAIAVVFANHDSICPEDSALLFVSGVKGSSYSWSPGGSTKDTLNAKPAITTTYTVTSIQGVTHYVNTIKLTVVPLPALIVSGTSVVCKGKTDTLIATGGVRYKWSNGSTQKEYITGKITGDSTIYVTAYNSLGCSLTDTFKITFKNCSTGIDEVNNANSVEVYPNPSTGKVTIQLSVVSNQWSVEVYNVLGEQVYSPFTIHNSPFTINLSSIPNGVYFYRVMDENGKLLGDGKFVIEK